MEKKLLILYVCFLIVTLVPASALETSSIISQKTEDIKANQASIIEDKNKISDSNDAINYHVNIIRDTIDGMNNVKWYQFWKWNFYINEGPQRIQDESKIVESLSQDVGKTSTNIGQNGNNSGNIGNTSLQLGIEEANKVTEPDTANNHYNSGIDKDNADLIASKLSSRFQTEYSVVSADTLNNGDIVQYPLTHNNYMYLQYVGLNPKGDTALFLGDSNTAVRLPVAALKSIQYKISPKTAGLNTKLSTSKLSNNKTILPPIENAFTSQLTCYIATIQKKGLEDYNNTKVNDYNKQIEDKKDTRNTGSNLMIAGGVIGSVVIGLTFTMYMLTDLCVVIGGMGAIFPPLLACQIPAVSSVVVLAWIVVVLGVTSAALLCTGGGIYATANSKINKLNGDKTTFINGCNAIETDLETYNNGAANNLPVAQNMFLDVEQNENLHGKLNATDKDGDGLFYNLDKKSANGDVAVNKNGLYVYAPHKGFVGNDSFTYKCNDGYGNSNIATVNVVVHPFNHAPVSADMMFDIETNTNLTGQLKATDQDGDPITYNILNTTSHGNITVNPDGTFTYTPTDGFIGNDSFTYTAKDWKENGNTATVQINVHPVNHLPVTQDVNLKVAKNENINSNFLAKDEDGDNLFFKLIDKPSKGTITLNTDGTFTYTPNKNVVGNDLFTYKANDWQGESNIGMVNIEIYEFNHPPVANNISITTQKNHPFTGLFNATDLDDDKLTYKIITKPTHGAINILNTGQFVYTPINGFTGNDKFTYTANDGKNQSNTATVEITVSNIIKTIKENALINNNQNTRSTNSKNTKETQQTESPIVSKTNIPTNSQTANTLNTTNTSLMNPLIQNNPINYVLSLINNTTHTIQQIIQQILKIIHN